MRYQWTGWGQRVPRMLFLALIACTITKIPNHFSGEEHNWVHASQNFIFLSELRFFVPSECCWLVPFRVPILLSTTAPHCSHPFAAVAAGQGDQRLLSQARMFRISLPCTCGFMKLVEQRLFLHCQICLKPSGKLSFWKTHGSATAWDLCL